MITVYSWSSSEVTPVKRSSEKTSTVTMVSLRSAAICGISWSEMSISLTGRSAGLKRLKESLSGGGCLMSGSRSTVRSSGALLYKSIGDQRMTTAFHLYETFPSESHLSPALLIVIQKKRGFHSFVTKALAKPGTDELRPRKSRRRRAHCLCCT